MLIQKHKLAAAKSALILLLLLTIVTGIVYPLLVTAIGQVLFRFQANGSLIKINDQVIGSELIGQNFTQAKYFWPRPSATVPAPYGETSVGSNYGPSNPAYLDRIKERVKALQLADPNNNNLIPIDLVTASGSGLDPDISLEAAYYQIPRIAKVRKMEPQVIKGLIDKVSKGNFIKFFSQPRVNVLQLNLALDSVTQPKEQHGR